jgi:heme A synthase
MSMRVVIFFLLTMFVCVGIGALQIVSGIKIPIWVSYALGAVVAAPLISYVSNRWYKEDEVVSTE